MVGHQFESHPVTAAQQPFVPNAAAQAAQAGVRSCLPVIEKMEAYLAKGQSGNSLAFWDRAAPDTHIFSAVLALENAAGNSIANLNVVPSPDGQCAIEYTQTGYAAQTCADYLRTMGNAARFVRDLNSKTALIQGRGVQILLSPAGQGCLWARKEILKQPGAGQSAVISPKPPAQK